MNYGFIYETTNLINGNKYIGKHKRYQNPDDPDDSWYLGSGKLITYAIDKYGSENFSREILCECSTEEELVAKEKYYIGKYDAINSERYYNICYDANPPRLENYRLMHLGMEENFIHPDQVNHYLSVGWELGHAPGYIDPKTGHSRIDMLGDNNPMRNPETARLNAKSREGYHHDEETIQRMKDGQRRRFEEVGHGVRKGILHREETKERIRQTKKQQYASGEVVHPMLGKSHKEDSLSKMRVAAKNRKISCICVLCGNEFIAGSAQAKYCPDCKKGWCK